MLNLGGLTYSTWSNLITLSDTKLSSVKLSSRVQFKVHLPHLISGIHNSPMQVNVSNNNISASCLQK